MTERGLRFKQIPLRRNGFLSNLLLRRQSVVALLLPHQPGKFLICSNTRKTRRPVFSPSEPYANIYITEYRLTLTLPDACQATQCERCISLATGQRGAKFRFCIINLVSCRATDEKFQTLSGFIGVSPSNLFSLYLFFPLSLSLFFPFSISLPLSLFLFFSTNDGRKMVRLLRRVLSWTWTFIFSFR